MISITSAVAIRMSLMSLLSSWVAYLNARSNARSELDAEMEELTVGF